MQESATIPDSYIFTTARSLRGVRCPQVSFLAEVDFLQVRCRFLSPQDATKENSFCQRIRQAPRAPHFADNHAQTALQFLLNSTNTVQRFR